MKKNMSYCNKATRNKNAGVSLLEVMVALAIIALIAGFAAPRILETFGRAKSQAALVQMGNIKSALQLYYLDTGQYPSEAEGLAALISTPVALEGWAGPYLDREDDILDPWRRPYIYKYPGTDGSFDLMSYGRDGMAGGTREDKDISF